MPESFVAALREYQGEEVFNPWSDIDPLHDCSDEGPYIRSAQLLQYLNERIPRADYLLCAEAIGFQGGHFSGIPMTSERLLLGGLGSKGLTADMVFRGLVPQRTSRPELRSQGFTEPTATIVWSFLADQRIDPRRVVLWNAFPWHPYQGRKGMLSNRTPTDRELTAGHQILHRLLALGGFRQVVAVGEKAARQLDLLAIQAVRVRHPANGGAGKFRRQMMEMPGFT